MNYFVDSNIFLRAVVEEDEKSFLECISLLRNLEIGKLSAVTSNVVLAEIVWTLKSFYKLERATITKSVKNICSLKGLKILDRFQTDKAINIYSKRSIKFIDCLIASIPEVDDKKWIVVSYDKDFDKLGILRKEPGELVNN